MHRSPSVCRRAVQSLPPTSPQHVWIPEELVSLVFLRFSRSRCPQQKRHGSHVPGPLEAKRRAAQRRMTAQAHASPQSGLPPSPFSFAALFQPRPNPGPSWRYEAPSPPKPMAPLIHLPENPPYDCEPTFLSPQVNLPEANSHFDLPDTTHLIVESGTVWPEALLRQEAGNNGRQAIAIDAQDGGSKSMPQSGRLDGLHDRDASEEVALTPRISRGAKSVRPADDLDTCWARFKAQIDLAESSKIIRQPTVLYEAVEHSFPSHLRHKQGRRFTVLMLEHLSRIHWPPPTVVATFAKLPTHFMPRLNTPEGIEFVRNLEDLIATGNPIPKLRDLSEKLAATVSKSRQTAQPFDQSLAILIRLNWIHLVQDGRTLDQIEPVLAGLVNQLSNSQVKDYLRLILGKRDNHLDRFVSLIRSYENSSEGYSVVSAVLSCIPRSLLHTWWLDAPLSQKEHEIESILAKLLGTADLSKGLYGNTKHVETCLGALHALDDQVVNISSQDGVLTLALTYLASRRVRPVDIKSFLATLSPTDLAHALLPWIARERSLRITMANHITKFNNADRLILQNRKQDDTMCRNKMLAELLYRMQESSIPNHNMAERVVQLLYHSSGMKSVTDLLRKLQAQGGSLSDTAFLDSLIKMSLKSRSTKITASNPEEHQHTAYLISLCHTIQKLKVQLTAYAIPGNDTPNKALAEFQSAWQFEHILQRAQKDRVLPLAYRNRPVSLPVDKRCPFIHQLAYQYSLDTTRSAQANWRSIYYLLEYLLENNHPIGPLFTRAIVRVCIARPLAEKRFVSARRMLLIFRVVARVEGVDVARKIEQLFWTWRGHVFADAQKAWDEYGGQGKAHVNTVKRLGLI
ncbi:hypothetical protein BDV95DRAFT_50149 [Massariosphaeria phaeospora]|uniref:Uncharacterized protein n=1 Tax=Massariosphaeria phaeospora TaxID=100035 RepID=A0A7C8MDZ3_9PLEO|nr:hypothetical protein BDV95DRAFT_50149 [Massariosphaeria phaeospora]